MVGVAQLVEPRIVIPVVVGSSPIVHPNFFACLIQMKIQRPHASDVIVLSQLTSKLMKSRYYQMNDEQKVAYLTQDNPKSNFYWYLLQTKFRQERKAAQELKQQNINVFLPLYRFEKLIKGVRVKKEEPLFSRYLFTRASSLDLSMESTSCGFRSVS